MKLPQVIIENQSHGIGARAALVKTQKTAPVIVVPSVNCDGAKNYVSLSLYYIPEGQEYSTYSDDQRYAVQVGNDVFNSDHAINIIGETFTLNGRSFHIPASSEGLVFIYIDDHVDTTPVTVKLIPSTNTVYNGIYEIDGYDGSLTEVNYVNKDTVMSFCLKPNLPPRQLSCVGATDNLVIDYKYKILEEAGNSYPETGMHYRYLIDDTYYFDFNFVYGGDNKHILNEGGDYLQGDVSYDGKLTLSIHTLSLDKVESRITISQYTSMPSPDYITIDEASNSTAFYDNINYETKVCLKYKESLPDLQPGV